MAVVTALIYSTKDAPGSGPVTVAVPDEWTSDDVARAIEQKTGHEGVRVLVRNTVEEQPGTLAFETEMTRRRYA